MLPIDAILPELIETLCRDSVAPYCRHRPGRAKTTRVPLAMLEANLTADGRIVMLEPRRLAARAAAERVWRTA